MSEKYHYKLADSVRVLRTCFATTLDEALLKFSEGGAGDLHVEHCFHQAATVANAKWVFSVTWEPVNDAPAAKSGALKLAVEIPLEMVERIIGGIMENFPEASNGCALRCHGWRYKAFEFSFTDDEEGKDYELDKAKLLAAFPLMFTDKWPKGCTPPPLSADWERWDDWLGQSDATSFDAFAQLACLGEVIYG